ncbi:hypothetical protein Ae263Ps1_3805c [Pseudonocardia sp. Ae263_Ps1]|nr:hypothetical protein Ae263Ps1_3805c [Pseudonocardia sp. Ae263_Ps1]
MLTGSRERRQNPRAALLTGSADAHRLRRRSPDRVSAPAFRERPTFRERRRIA